MFEGSSLFSWPSINHVLILIWPTQRVSWSLVALFDCWYFQLSSTLTPSAGGGGKGSPSSPGGGGGGGGGRKPYRHAMKCLAECMVSCTCRFAYNCFIGASILRGFSVINSGSLIFNTVSLHSSFNSFTNLRLTSPQSITLSTYTFDAHHVKHLLYD